MCGGPKSEKAGHTEYARLLVEQGACEIIISVGRIRKEGWTGLHRSHQARNRVKSAPSTRVIPHEQVRVGDQQISRKAARWREFDGQRAAGFSPVAAAKEKKSGSRGQIVVWNARGRDELGLITIGR